MKLRNRKSFMTSLPEGEAPRNSRASITQIIYFSVIFMAVSYLLYIFAQKYFYFNEWGVVEVEKIIISSGRDGLIAHLGIKEGQSLKRNDVIAILEATRHDCSTEESMRIDKLRYETDLNISKKLGLNAQLKQLNISLQDFELHRALELDRGLLRDTERLKRERDVILNNIANVGREISLQKKRLESILAQQRSAGLPEGCYREKIVAPFDAIVAAVQKKEKEFTQRGGAIVTLVKNDAPVRIEAYLDSDVLRLLNKGEMLDLEFPDGVRSEGSIKAVYSSAYAVPERQWNNYKPVTPQIRVHLQPVHKKDRQLWLTYDRMEVRVRGRK